MNSRQAIQWAENEVTLLGYQLKGKAEIVRAMPWSVVSRLATDKGYVYFKQMSPQFAVEPYVLHYLYKNFASSVPQVIAHNNELQCFLMPEVGSRLREKLKLNYQLPLASLVLKSYAHIQLKTIQNTKQLLSLGIKDWRLSQLPAVFEQLLLQTELLAHDGISAQEIESLHQLAPRFNAACEKLADFGIPESIEHGDFQDNNILTDDNGKVFINDWGDANVTHPFFSLGSWLDSASRHHGFHKGSERYQALTQAYLEEWQEYGDLNQLTDAFSASEYLRPILFCINFCRVASCPGMEELGEFKGYIATALREFISQA